MKIYDEHIADSGRHKRFEQLQDQDYKPSVESLHTVASGSQDHSYLIAKVGCLSVEFKQADVSKDTTTVYLCSCDDHWFTQSKGFENGDQQPDEIGECKHITSEFKAKRAKEDNKQDTL